MCVQVPRSFPTSCSTHLIHILSPVSSSLDPPRSPPILVLRPQSEQRTSTHVLVIKKRSSSHRVSTHYGKANKPMTKKKGGKPQIVLPAYRKPKQPPPTCDQPLDDLEHLMFKYPTDKSKDDHKYSDLYSIILDPIRDRVRNVTETGVAQGWSLAVWNEYFCAAKIYGVDISIVANLRALVPLMDRVVMFKMDAMDPKKLVPSSPMHLLIWLFLRKPGRPFCAN